MTVIEQRMGGMADELLWPVILREKRCLVTADKGFANAQLHPPGTHAGIVLFRLPLESRSGYVRLAQRLIGSGMMDELSGAVTAVGPDAIRIHR